MKIKTNKKMRITKYRGTWVGQVREAQQKSYLKYRIQNANINKNTNKISQASQYKRCLKYKMKSANTDTNNKIQIKKNTKGTKNYLTDTEYKLQMKAQS